MARQQRIKIDFTVDSLLKHYQQIYNNLESLRNRATQDYNRVVEILKASQNEAGIVMQMDAARNNALNTFDKYFAKKVELLRLQKDVIGLLNKSDDAGALKGSISEDDKLQMQKMYKELKKIEDEKDGGKPKLSRGE